MDQPLSPELLRKMNDYWLAAVQLLRQYAPELKIRVINDLDRFHLAGDVIDRVPKLRARAAYAKQALRDKLIEHKEYINRYGEDMPEVRDWRWKGEVQT